jgi:acetyl esterase/lipase
MRDLTHGGSRLNLLGENPSLELVDFLSSELQVNSQTPPCFLLHTFEDQAVPVLNSVNFAKSLAKHSVPFELHVYERGAHGIGLGCNPFDPKNLHPWVGELGRWLVERGFGK